MNDKKISFIICVNNKLYFDECLYYLEQLVVPEGYDTEVLAIADAASMTSGYNEGMKKSDAKYKIYMHQDVFIVNPQFISDMLKVFAMDDTIALMGMIGVKRLQDDANMVPHWDTGKIFHNCTPPKLEFEMDNVLYQEVEAVDGLLLATQMDTPWREDVFDGWDYYDISQCMEFLRKGRKVVVPYQKEPWVWHDNLYSKMLNYYNYTKPFMKEYSDIHNFVYEPVPENIWEFNNLKEQLRREMFDIVDSGNKEELVNIFQKPENRGYLVLKDFQILADIEYLENNNRVSNKFWLENDTSEILLKKVGEVKYALKRIEFQKKTDETLLEKYSPYVIGVIHEAYVF